MNTTFYNVLFIEDDDLIRSIYSERLLQESLFRVDVAVDGQDGWNKLQMNTYDLVITGIQMPYKTGFEVYELMQKESRLASIPVIIFSHLGRSEDAEKANNLGIDYFIIRGQYTPNDLADLVKSILLKDSQSYVLQISQDSPDYHQFLKAFLGEAQSNSMDQTGLKVLVKSVQFEGQACFTIEKYA